MSKEVMKLALEAAYLAGWDASGEGYNAEYPFGDHARNPEEDAAWIEGRDQALREALAEPPAMPVVPDAIHHTDTSESLEYITGWNDCRAAMLEQPAQRTWFGLTDEKADELVQRFARYELLRAIETELRNKNEVRS